MNGNTNGIVPTVDLATNSFPYPMYGGYGNNGFLGGEGIWALILIALLFGNGNWGGNFGGNNVATTDFVSSQFTQNSLQDLATQMSTGFANTNSNISNGFASAATNTCNLRADVLTGNMGIQNSILDSKYANALSAGQTQRDVLVQTTQLENQLSNVALSNQAHIDSCCCDIKSLIREDGEKTRSLITQNTIQDLRDKLTNANNQLSDQAVISAVRPYPVPSYLVSSPYSSIYNGFGGFYGNGFFGNTVI